MSTTKRARKRAPPPSNTSSDSSDPETSDMEELLFRARIRLTFLAKSVAQNRTQIALRNTARARRADFRTQQRAELDLQEQEDLTQAREEQQHIEILEEELADLGKLFCDGEKTAEAKTALRHARRKSQGRTPARKRQAFDPEMSEVESVSIKISSSQQEAREEVSMVPRTLSGDTTRTISDPTPSGTSFNLPDPFSTPIRPQHVLVPASGSTTRDPSPPPSEPPVHINLTSAVDRSLDLAAPNFLYNLPSTRNPTHSAPRDLTPLAADRPTTRHPRKAAPKILSVAALMSAQITPSQMEDVQLDAIPERRKTGRPRGSKSKVPGRRGGRGGRGGLGRGGGGFGHSAENGVGENDGGVGGNDGGDVGEGSVAMGVAVGGGVDEEVEITGARVKDESVGAELQWTPGSSFRPKEEVRFMTERKVKQPGLFEMWGKAAARRKSEPADF